MANEFITIKEIARSFYRVCLFLIVIALCIFCVGYHVLTCFFMFFHAGQKHEKPHH
jgi:hypothetical protein